MQRRSVIEGYAPNGALRSHENVKTRRAPSLARVVTTRRDDQEVLTFRVGVRHQVALTWLGLKAVVAFLPFSAGAIFLFADLFEPMNTENKFGNVTNNTNYTTGLATFGYYKRTQQHDMGWFLVNCTVIGLSLHFLWWGFTQYVFWKQTRKLFQFTSNSQVLTTFLKLN